MSRPSSILKRHLDSGWTFATTTSVSRAEYHEYHAGLRGPRVRELVAEKSVTSPSRAPFCMN
jgi:hypothetical protein